MECLCKCWYVKSCCFMNSVRGYKIGDLKCSCRHLEESISIFIYVQLFFLKTTVWNSHHGGKILLSMADHYIYNVCDKERIILISKRVSNPCFNKVCSISFNEKMYIGDEGLRIVEQKAY